MYIYDSPNTSMIGAAGRRNHLLRVTGAPSETQELRDFAEDAHHRLHRCSRQGCAVARQVRQSQRGREGGRSSNIQSVLLFPV